MESQLKSDIFVAGAPRECNQCKGAICMRQQVVNLALGKVEEMLCLRCLHVETECEPASTLERMIPYIQSRDCFLKPWNRYKDVSYCPDRDSCCPSVCFAKEDETH